MQKCLEGMRPADDVNDPHSLTVVDIECGIARVRLRPIQLDLLDPEKEDIGMAQPIVLQDYLSPPRRSSGPFEVQLSPKSLLKCRKACDKFKPKGKQKGAFQTSFLKAHKGKCKECDRISSLKEKRAEKGKETTKEGDYLVELSPDETKLAGHQAQSLEKEEELQLASAVRESLSLKRNRSTLEWGDQSLNDEVKEAPQKKTKHGEQDMEFSTEGGQLPCLDPTPMAEEAGLHKPPPAQ